MKAPRPAEEALTLRIARLTLAEGDTLVASLEASFPAHLVPALRENLEMATPKGVAVLIIGHDVKLSVLGE